MLASKQIENEDLNQITNDEKDSEILKLNQIIYDLTSEYEDYKKSMEYSLQNFKEKNDFYESEIKDLQSILALSQQDLEVSSENLSQKEHELGLLNQKVIAIEREIHSLTQQLISVEVCDDDCFYYLILVVIKSFILCSADRKNGVGKTF
jgi:hypothetical protein